MRKGIYLTESLKNLKILKERLKDVQKKFLGFVNELIPDGIFFILGHHRMFKDGVNSSNINFVIDNYNAFLTSLHTAIEAENVRVEKRIATINKILKGGKNELSDSD
jgi:hypothetical protein